MSFISELLLPLVSLQMVRPWKKKRKVKRIVGSTLPRRSLACMAVQRRASVPNMYLNEFQMLLSTLLLITVVDAYSYEFHWRPRGTPVTHPQVRMVFLLPGNYSSANIRAAITAAFEFLDDAIMSFILTSDVTVFMSICAGHQ
jgi:hypothetical protein